MCQQGRQMLAGLRICPYGFVQPICDTSAGALAIDEMILKIMQLLTALKTTIESTPIE
jgi:hypothetical protein